MWSYIPNIPQRFVTLRIFPGNSRKIKFSFFFLNTISSLLFFLEQLRQQRSVGPLWRHLTKDPLKSEMMLTFFLFILQQISEWVLSFTVWLTLAALLCDNSCKPHFTPLLLEQTNIFSCFYTPATISYFRQIPSLQPSKNIIWASKVASNSSKKALKHF